MLLYGNTIKTIKVARNRQDVHIARATTSTHQAVDAARHTPGAPSLSVVTVERGSPTRSRPQSLRDPQLAKNRKVDPVTQHLNNALEAIDALWAEEDGKEPPRPIHIIMREVDEAEKLAADEEVAQAEIARARADPELPPPQRRKYRVRVVCSLCFIFLLAILFVTAILTFTFGSLLSANELSTFFIPQ